jgi:Na+(H+)/acetate symporter ActP
MQGCCCVLHVLIMYAGVFAAALDTQQALLLTHASALVTDTPIFVIEPFLIDMQQRDALGRLQLHNVGGCLVDAGYWHSA